MKMRTGVDTFIDEEIQVEENISPLAGSDGTETECTTPENDGKLLESDSNNDDQVSNIAVEDVKIDSTEDDVGNETVEISDSTDIKMDGDNQEEEIEENIPSLAGSDGMEAEITTPA